MENQIQNVNQDLITNLVLNNDISKMSDVQKVQYYNWLCESLQLNPATRPFQLIILNGKQTLYATKDATEQLRKINGVSVIESLTEIKDGLCITKIKVQDKTGRYDISTGIVNLTGLNNNDKANAIMKAETKAKRRATLSICGLGILDETELDTIPNYQTSDIQAIEENTNGGNKNRKLEIIELLNKSKTVEELHKVIKEVPAEFKNEKFNQYVESLEAKLININDVIPFDIPEQEDINKKSIKEDAEFPEITKMKKINSINELTLYYDSIKGTPFYPDYDEDYKMRIDSTYKTRLKQLKKKEK